MRPLRLIVAHQVYLCWVIWTTEKLTDRWERSSWKIKRQQGLICYTCLESLLELTVVFHQTTVGTRGHRKLTRSLLITSKEVMLTFNRVSFYICSRYRQRAMIRGWRRSFFRPRIPLLLLLYKATSLHKSICVLYYCKGRWRSELTAFLLGDFLLWKVIPTIEDIKNISALKEAPNSILCF